VLKRLADWLEKLSVGSLLVALYQGSTTDSQGYLAAAISAAALAVSFVFSRGGVK
jgi:hypothetical protein